MDYRYRSTRPINYTTPSTQYGHYDPLGYSSYSTPYDHTSSYQTVGPHKTAPTRTTDSTSKQLFSDRTNYEASSGLRGSTYKNHPSSYRKVGSSNTYLSQTQQPLAGSKKNSFGEPTSGIYDNRTAVPASSSNTKRSSFYDTYRGFNKNTPGVIDERDIADYKFKPSTRSLRASGYSASTPATNASRRAQPPSQSTPTYRREPEILNGPQQPQQPQRYQKPPQFQRYLTFQMLQM